MVAFCATFIIQSINQSTSIALSDWALYRIATLQELIKDFEAQSAALHPPENPDWANSVEVVARHLSQCLRLLLCKKHRLPQPDLAIGMDSVANNAPLDLDELMASFAQAPFVADWTFDQVMGDAGFTWDFEQ